MLKNSSSSMWPLPWGWPVGPLRAAKTSQTRPSIVPGSDGRRSVRRSVGRWSSVVVGPRSSVVGRSQVGRRSVVGRQQSHAGRWSLAVGRRPSVAHRPSSVVGGGWWVVGRRQSSVVNRRSVRRSFGLRRRRLWPPSNTSQAVPSLSTLRKTMSAFFSGMGRTLGERENSCGARGQCCASAGSHERSVFLPVRSMPNLGRCRPRSPQPRKASNPALRIPWPQQPWGELNSRPNDRASRTAWPTRVAPVGICYGHTGPMCATITPASRAGSGSAAFDQSLLVDSPTPWPCGNITVITQTARFAAWSSSENIGDPAARLQRSADIYRTTTLPR